MSPTATNGVEDDELLTTARVATLLAVSRSSVLRYIERGDLPAMRLPSGVYRVPRSAVDKLLRQIREGI